MNRKEAIKEVRSFIGQLTEGCQEAIRALVPELRESEDERIWKAIDEIMRLDKAWEIAGKHGLTAADIRGWVKKQKEQKPAEWSEEEIVNWLKENFYVSSFDNTKIVTKFSSMDDLIKSFHKRFESLLPF